MRHDGFQVFSSVFRLQLQYSQYRSKCFLGNLTCLWLVCRPVRALLSLRAPQSLALRPPRARYAGWRMMTSDDCSRLFCSLLHLLPLTPNIPNHEFDGFGQFWWLEVVVISRVHPSRIFLHQQTHGHSQWSLWVPLPQGKKSKKKKSTCCWGGHFRVVETTRVSWPDLPFPWIWARKPRTAGQQKIWQTWDVACGNFSQFMRGLVGLVFKMLLNSSAHFGLAYADS